MEVIKKIIQQSLSGDNGIYSSKKLTGFHCLMLGSFLILLEVFSQGTYKAPHEFIYMLFAGAGVMPFIGMVDKHINDIDKTTTEINIKSETN